MNRDRIFLLLPVLTALLLWGCAATAPVPQDHFYRLTTPGGLEPFPQTALSRTLIVERVRASGILRERALLYSDGRTPESVKQHHYHHWTDTPPALIQEQFLTYLRSRNLSDHVSAEQQSPAAALRIRLELKRFERVLGADGGVQVVVALEAVIRDGLASRPLLVKSYRIQRAVPGPEILSSVRILNEALIHIYGQVTRDLLEVASGR